MITFIVPTIGRASLARTLASIEAWPGDEILVVCDVLALDVVRSLIAGNTFVTPVLCPRGGDWGHTERNFSTPLAKGKYIAHIDDDDMYRSGTRALMADAIEKTPDRPVIFRMRFPNGVTLWQEPAVKCGNLGTPCFLIPNKPEMLGTWKPFVGGDCAFLESSKWKAEDYVWRPEVIALLGHNA